MWKYLKKHISCAQHPCGSGCSNDGADIEHLYHHKKFRCTAWFSGTWE